MRWINIFHAYQPPDWDPAVIQRVVKECYQPTVAFLLAHPNVKITLNLAGSLTDQLAAHGHHSILQGLKQLTDRKQVELMMMPKYHPIIPFLTPDELRRQLAANADANGRVLGASYRPSGFFPPELAIDRVTGSQAEQAGARWILLDELALGAFGTVNPEQHYVWQGTGLRILFRNRTVSDYLAFEVQPAPRRTFGEILHALNAGDATVITAMDLENLGHHRPGADAAWQALVTEPDVETLTASEYLAFPHQRTDVTPVACSWSTDDHDLTGGVPYPLWDNPQNPVHQALLRLYRQAGQVLLGSTDHPRYTEARERLDRAQASDVFWWASMRPMWDASIVLREAAELFHSLDPVCGQPHPLQDLWTDVQRIVHEWDSNGAAGAARARYLDEHDSKQFFAGHHVT